VDPTSRQWIQPAALRPVNPVKRSVATRFTLGFEKEARRETEREERTKEKGVETGRGSKGEREREKKRETPCEGVRASRLGGQQRDQRAASFDI